MALLGLAACDPDSVVATSEDEAAGKADGAGQGAGAASLLCDATTWLDPVPVSGNALMAHAGRAYVFAQDGLTWQVVEDEVATTEPIPLPPGIAEMRSARAEISPSGRPLVTFRSEGANYAALFDGSTFVNVTPIGNAVVAHADAAGHIYTVDHGGVGLVEHVPGVGPIYRGGLVEQPRTWGVGADGTVYVFVARTRPSTIHRGQTANILVMRQLPHGTLTWSGDTEVFSNEGWGFSNVHFAAGRDGSLHLVYALTSSTYYVRSMDGVDWERRTPTDIVSRATMVDPASPLFDNDPSRVRGSIALLTAQDYDHATVTLTYNQGSFSVPGYYHLRNCAPYSGLNETWPAERLAMTGQAFAPALVAVDERGLTTIVTPAGARQNVIDGGIDPCDECGAPPPGPDLPDHGDVPSCAAAEVHGPIATAVNLQSAASYGEPLMAVRDDVRVFVGGSTHWMEASYGSAATVHRPDPYADAQTFRAERSISGGHTVTFRRGNTVFVSANDGAPIATPCGLSSVCDARVAGDGHVWLRTPDLYEQVGDTFEARGGPPVSVSTWDVDAAGNVHVASVSSRHGPQYRSFWRLAAGGLGWQPVGALSNDLVNDVAAQIEGGFQEGGALFGYDGSFHVFSTARNIGTGQRNRVQFHLRSADLQSWEAHELPSIETLAGDADHVGWRYAGFWAASHDRVRYVVMTSRKPVSDGWGWSYPGSRQLHVVDRCRAEDGEITYASVATVNHPGWTTPGYHAFSGSGVAAMVTSAGLTQVR
jgi:hypothetical protein